MTYNLLYVIIFLKGVINIIESDKILTPEEVAEILKINKQTVRSYLKKGKMRGFQVGSYWRVKREDLNDFIEQNMNTNINNEDETNEFRDREDVSVINIGQYQLDEDYTGRKISKFKFKSQTYQVRNWKEMLIKFIQIMASSEENFDEVLGLKGRTRWYFSKDEDELRKPEMIKNTDIYVETNLNNNQKIQICKAMLGIFGYRSDDFKIICD